MSTQKAIWERRDYSRYSSLFIRGSLKSVQLHRRALFEQDLISLLGVRTSLRGQLIPTANISSSSTRYNGPRNHRDARDVKCRECGCMVRQEDMVGQRCIWCDDSNSREACTRTHKCGGFCAGYGRHIHFCSKCGEAFL